MASSINLTAQALPYPACYGSEQERFEAYVNAILAELAADKEWHVGQIAPEDLDLYWLQLGNDLRPIGIYKYVAADAAWVPVFREPVFGVSTGAAGAFSLANDPVFTTTGSAYRVGQVYTFKANHATTGASTLEIDGLGAKAIKTRVTQDTIKDTIVVDQIVTVVYDGINFQMLSPGGGASIPVADLAPGTEGAFIRTRLVASVLTTVWEGAYQTAVADYKSIPARGTSESFVHGLGVVPLTYGMRIVCVSSELGYSTDDEIDLAYTTIINDVLSDDNAPTVWGTSSIIGYQVMPSAQGIRVSHKTTGTVTAIDDTKWKLKAWAIK